MVTIIPGVIDVTRVGSLEVDNDTEVDDCCELEPEDRNEDVEEEMEEAIDDDNAGIEEEDELATAAAKVRFPVHIDPRISEELVSMWRQSLTRSRRISIRIGHRTLNSTRRSASIIGI